MTTDNEAPPNTLALVADTTKSEEISTHALFSGQRVIG